MHFGIRYVLCLCARLGRGNSHKKADKFVVLRLIGPWTQSVDRALRLIGAHGVGVTSALVSLISTHHKEHGTSRDCSVDGLWQIDWQMLADRFELMTGR